jgi:hypothetical protein
MLVVIASRFKLFRGLSFESPAAPLPALRQLFRCGLPHAEHPSAQVEANMMSTSGVPSNTYTKKYVEVARAAGEEWGSVNIF